MKKRGYNKILLIVIFAVTFSFSADKIALAANQTTLPQGMILAFNWAMGIASLLALISLVFGAMQFMTAAANPSGQKEGTDRIIASVLGLFLLLGCWLIMQTINPQITSLNIFSGMAAGPGIYYSNGNIKQDKPANQQEPDSSKMPSGYNKIRYTCISGKGPNLLIWFYPLKFFQDNAADFSGTQVVTLSCGHTANIFGASFRMQFETSGVFLFFQSGCKGYMSEPFTSDQSALPDMYQGKIKSIKISNQVKYPAEGYTDYMVIFRDQANLDGTANCTYPLFLGSNGKNSDCIDVNPKYTTSAFIKNLNDHNVVTQQDTYGKNLGLVFFSKPWGWESKAISGFMRSIADGYYIKNLWMSLKPSDIKLKYCTGNNDCPPQNYQDMCPDFTKTDCQGSIQVLGTYLVVLSTDPKYGTTYAPTNISVCQAFSSKISFLRETEFFGEKNTIGSIAAIPLQ